MGITTVELWFIVALCNLAISSFALTMIIKRRNLPLARNYLLYILLAATGGQAIMILLKTAI